MIPGVRKVGPNNWEFRANAPGSHGKQIRRRGFPTQDTAYRARNRYLSGSEVTNTRHLLLSEWLDRWLLMVKETKRPTTYSGYRVSVERDIKPIIGDIELAELTSEDVRTCYRAMVESGYATETIKATSRRFKTALYAAINEEPPLITTSPARNVVAPKGKPTRKRRIWTFEQLVKFSQFVAGERDHAMWALWISTGLRRGELCGLYWPKVEFDVAEVVIDWQRTKTSEGVVVEGPVKTETGERRVPLVPAVLAALRAWKADQAAVRLTKGTKWRGGDYVFTTFRGTPWFPDSLNDRLNRLTNAAGLPRLSPHELRHTYATRALENGMEVKVLSTMLGHSRVQTTMDLYVHPNTKQMHDAQQALAARMFG